MITMMKERNPMRMMQQKEEEREEEDQEDEKKTKKNEQREEIYEEKKLLLRYTREDVSKSSFFSDYRRWARVERGTLFASGREQSVGTI